MKVVVDIQNCTLGFNSFMLWLTCCLDTKTIFFNLTEQFSCSQSIRTLNCSINYNNDTDT